MDIAQRRQVISKFHMTRNRMFPLKIISDLKEGNFVAAIRQEMFQEQVKDDN